MSENLVPYEDKNSLDNLFKLVTIDHDIVANNIKNEVAEGNINPIEAFLVLKRFSKIVELTLDSQKGDKELREIFKTSVQKALDGGKSVTMFGATLSLQATGVKYDFTECNDSVLNAAYKIQKEIEEFIKKREEEIKVLLPSEDNKTLGIRSRAIIQTGVPTLSFSDDEFEETIFPPVKKGGESVVVRFAKKKY